MATPKMTVRRVQFNLKENLSKHYIAGNVFATHYMNSLHVIFPEGEKFFIRSVKKFQHVIQDEKLKKDIKDFIGQEGVHFNEHHKFWSVLAEQGLEPMNFAQFYVKTGYDGLEKLLYKSLGEEGGAKLALSVTAALEHYTAMFGEWALSGINGDMFLSEEMKLLMHWHAAEEIEHKAVTFDVLKAVDDSYSRRVIGMLIASWGLFFYSVIGTIYFIAKDKDKNWWTLPGEFLGFITKMGGNYKRGNLIGNLLEYFKKDFHPNQIDNYHLAEEFFSKNKGFYQEVAMS
ncbi:MAG: metal-dependent hydrolase [Chitinophagales bacterium]|nr:metal-dependent hydrolase [Chitinophagales bacterium]